MNLRAQLESYGCGEAVLEYKTDKGVEQVIECWKKPDDPELLAMDVFYADIYDGDEDILRNNKLNKEERETDNGDDTKF